MRLLKVLENKGWLVRTREAASFVLPEVLERRYGCIPPEVLDFLSQVRSCSSPDEASWLLGANDYQVESGTGFSWNEIEEMSLESCQSEAERSEVRAFWDGHFPLALSVRSEYDYLAICVAGEGKGKILHGYAPEWESPSVVASSFSEFLVVFERAAVSADPEYPFNIFL